MNPTHTYLLNQNTSKHTPRMQGMRKYSHTIKKVYEVPVEYIGPSKTKGWVVIKLPNKLLKHVKEHQIKEIKT